MPDKLVKVPTFPDPFSKFSNQTTAILDFGTSVGVVYFLIEGMLVSKNLFSESCSQCPKTYGWTPPRPHCPFWEPLAAILDFAGGAALQAVSECPRRR